VAIEDRAAQAASYHELCAYTLTHGDPGFIHQHVVDAFAAQNADANTKPIKLAFALIGLYLLLERNSTGRQVQRVHRLLANRRKQWPRFDLPADRGMIWPSDVLAAPPGRARDELMCLRVAGVQRQPTGSPRAHPDRARLSASDLVAQAGMGPSARELSLSVR
jgi:hypothetical protein